MIQRFRICSSRATGAVRRLVMKRYLALTSLCVVGSAGDHLNDPCPTHRRSQKQKGSAGSWWQNAFTQEALFVKYFGTNEIPISIARKIAF